MSAGNVDPVKGLVSWMARNLVDHPEGVTVTVIEMGDTDTYEIRVAPGDLGKVIGKQGRIANALRSVARAAAFQSRRRVHVEIEG